MAKEQNLRLGIWLMVVVTIIFGIQDGLSRHLAGEYNVWMVVMIRYWFFGAFVCAMAARSPGGIRGAVRSRAPWTQVLRGLLLAVEICVMVFAFTLLGLVESHAVFATYPLLVAALSGPVLGEHVGWRRWTAIAIGFVGVIVILSPGSGVFSPLALIPLAAAGMFALYGLLTRLVARVDEASVSFFWTGIGGAVIMTLPGLWHWQAMAPADWGLMAVLCLTAVSSHWLLIRAYEVAEASAIQPLAYLQLLWVSIIGLLIFDEALRTNVVIGGAIVVAAGLFTLWRQRVRGQD